MLMLFNKLTLISIAAIIAIASILVFIIPTDSIETQSVINSEKPSINHTLSLDQSISVSEANNRVAINLFKLLETDTQKNIFFSPFSILTAMTMDTKEHVATLPSKWRKRWVYLLMMIHVDWDCKTITLDYELNVANR